MLETLCTTEFHSSCLVAVFRCLYGPVWSISSAIPYLLVASFLRVLPLNHSGQFGKLKQTPQCFCFDE